MLEGTIQGEERCNRSGVEYTFDGHFLGNDVVVYRISVVDEEGQVAGYIRGQLTTSHLNTRSDVWRAIEDLVRRAVRDGDFLHRKAS